MDFSEIGVKSRKTGLVAKDNVKRDENNMEDVEDFFRDDQTTHTNNNNSSQRSKGRIIFPREGGNSHSIRSSRNSPLRSPLQTRTEKTTSQKQLSSNVDIPTNDDLFTDAHEEPQIEGDIDSEENMDIDNESKGTIRVINNNDDYNNNNNYEDYDYDVSLGDEDLDKVPLPISKSTPSTLQKKGKKLFYSSSDDDSVDEEPKNDRPLSREERQQQLERNISVRSPSKRSYNKSNESTPKRFQTSPLASSKLHSPLQPKRPSSKSIASIAKNIALNKPNRNKLLTKKKNEPIHLDNIKEKRTARDYSSDDNSEYQVSENNDDDNESDSLSPIVKSEAIPSETDEESGVYEEDDSEEITESKANESSDNEEDEITVETGRGRKTNRDVITNEPVSPESRRHIIKASELEAEQKSRSSSRFPEERQPTRRSSRIKVAPLAFWRNERAVFEKRKGDAVPTLKEIITVDEIPDTIRTRPPSRARSKASTRSNSRIRATKKEPPTKRKFHILPEVVVEDDGEEEEEENDTLEKEIAKGSLYGSEWIKDGRLKIDAFEGHGSDIKSERTVAWSSRIENYTQHDVITGSDNFKLAILFDQNKEFIATGMMTIPPGGTKSMKSTDTTYFVFYCISGIVHVKLSGSEFYINKGCSLEIPMGNFYEFVNNGNKDARLFFVQTRGHEIDEWE